MPWREGEKRNVDRLLSAATLKNYSERLNNVSKGTETPRQSAIRKQARKRFQIETRAPNDLIKKREKEGSSWRG